ncbi:MAG: MOSC domain-containing protein [Isosphaeraceae bacterium]
MTQPVVLSIQVGQPVEYGQPGANDPMDQPWTTSFVKAPVAGPLVLGLTNLDGDAQADLVHHGGPDKAVLCYSAHHYPPWRGELNRLDLAAGDFGENLTILGLTEADVCIGDIWRVGDALTQITQPRQPCWKLARRWRIKDLALQVQQTGRTGWYLRVLTPGTVAAGLPLTLVERPFPEWSVDRANGLMHLDKHNHALAATLASIPPLSASWKTTLTLRAEHGVQPDAPRRLHGLESG